MVDFLKPVKDFAKDKYDDARRAHSDKPPDPSEPCPLESAEKAIGSLMDTYNAAKQMIEHPSLENAANLLRKASQALKDADTFFPLKQLEEAKKKVDKAIEYVEKAQKIVKAVEKTVDDAKQVADDAKDLAAHPCLDKAGKLLHDTSTLAGDAKDDLADVNELVDNDKLKEASAKMGKAQKTLDNAAGTADQADKTLKAADKTADAVKDLKDKPSLDKLNNVQTVGNQALGSGANTYGKAQDTKNSGKDMI